MLDRLRAATIRDACLMRARALPESIVIVGADIPEG